MVAMMETIYVCETISLVDSPRECHLMRRASPLHHSDCVWFAVRKSRKGAIKHRSERENRERQIENYRRRLREMWIEWEILGNSFVGLSVVFAPNPIRMHSVGIAFVSANPSIAFHRHNSKSSAFFPRWFRLVGELRFCAITNHFPFSFLSRWVLMANVQVRRIRDGVWDRITKVTHPHDKYLQYHLICCLYAAEQQTPKFVPRLIQ